MAGQVQPAVLEAIQQSRFEDVAALLEAAELQSEATEPLRVWPHALHVLAHVYNKDLEDARFVWKRLPEDVKQASPELQAAFRLLQSLWNHNYQSVWAHLKGHQWSPETAPLVEALGARLQGEMLQLLGRAYVCIHPAQAAALLGTSEPDAVALATGQGWTVDPANGMLMVHKKQGTDQQWNGTAALQQLSEYMIHLEQ